MRRASHYLTGLLALAAPLLLHADSIAVGQFSIASPAGESAGFYGFTITNLTGSQCTAGYPVCDVDLVFENATLTVDYGYAQVDSTGAVINGTLTGTGTYTANAQDVDPFDPASNYCGVYGVDSGCAGADDTANAFQLAEPIVDGNGNTLVILSASFSAVSAPTNSAEGVLSGPYTAQLTPQSDCSGPCAFPDGNNNWEFYDQADIVTEVGGSPTGGQGPPATTPEPATLWLLTPLLALWLGWRRPWSAERGW